MLYCRAVPALGVYDSIQAEVKSGPDGKSRVDFLLRRPSGSLVFVEVKSVTLTEDVACLGPKASEVSTSGASSRSSGAFTPACLSLLLHVCLSGCTT